LRDAHGVSDAGKAFPLVTGKFGQRPQIAKGVGSPPRNPAFVVLEEGGGASVRNAEEIPVIRYVRTDWVTGTVSHDSWASGVSDEPLPTDPVGAFLSADLDNLRVGSRLEALVPYATTAAVFVVDVVGVQPRPGSGHS